MLDPRKRKQRQGGYMLITLMLVLALVSIGLLAVIPDIRQQIRRDREEEMRHRGTSYMRAIQHFYKKFGRYPSRPEELENTNNLRFIRKLYKDPMNRDPATGKERDFKFLHQQDVSLNNGPLLGAIPGQGGLAGQAGLAAAAGLGGAQGAQMQAALGALQGGLGGAMGAAGGLQQQVGTGLQGATSGDSANGLSGNSSDTGGNPNSPPGSPSSNSGTGSGMNGATFGGGPILGVASLSKEKSIRVFFDKNHYNDWLFIYVPQGDRGGLLVGPMNPNMPPTPNLNGAAIPGLPGAAQGLGGLGAVQGLTPNAGQSQMQPTQPSQNSGQTPPQQ
jgi:type II secretory pathway pseudopilin PulG